MKKLYSWLSKELVEYKLILRNIPSLTISIFILSVVCANLFANKELFTCKFIALDCGFAFSWIMFLCMDVICKMWGARASIKVSILALFINLVLCLIFDLLAKTPGNWAAFYDFETPFANEVINSTFSSSWYVVFGSALAFLISSIVNSLLNAFIGSLLKSDNFGSFAIRSYISTAIGQLVDNFVFATVVSKVFFGWTWTQVAVCSSIAAIFELLCEIVFSGFGYKTVCHWKNENVGKEYSEYLQKRKKIEKGFCHN